MGITAQPRVMSKMITVTFAAKWMRGLTCRIKRSIFKLLYSKADQSEAEFMDQLTNEPLRKV